MSKPPQDKPPAHKPWIDIASEWTAPDPCEQWPKCPSCGGGRVVRNGWLFCSECLFAESLHK